MATQLVGGGLADRYEGKRVLAGGIAWFSAASLLPLLLLQPATVAAGLTVAAVLLGRFLTVGCTSWRAWEAWGQRNFW